MSAFSNSFGGRLYFGVENNGAPVGLSDVQETAEQISRFIKERISPIPEFNLTVALGLVKMTIPDKPKSRSQKYIRA